MGLYCVVKDPDCSPKGHFCFIRFIRTSFITVFLSTNLLYGFKLCPDVKFTYWVFSGNFIECGGRNPLYCSRQLQMKMSPWIFLPYENN